MNILTRSFIVFFAFVVQTITPAYAEQLFCNTSTETSPYKTVVVYGNGILNTRRQAGISLNAIQDRLRAILPPEKFATLDFKLAYNQSVGLFADMKETWRQKAESDNFDSLFWRMMSDASLIPLALQDDYQKRLTSLDAWGPLEKADVTAHLDLYRTSIRDGKKVIVVAHSQGNLFANKAYDILYSGDSALSTKSFGIIAVASPANTVGGNALHTTLETDHIISTVRKESADSDRNLAPPLPWNVQNKPTGWDPEGHKFVGEYLLAGSLSESKILGDILYTDNHLEQPSASDSIISVAITSNTVLGMNLQITEPSGSQVANLTPIGASGFFDLVDNTGYGTERYVVPCSKLQEGSYTIRASYTHGQGPNNGLTLEVRIGTLVKNYILPSTSPDGRPLTYNAFYPIGSVEVVRDPTAQGYTFNQRIIFSST